MALTFDTGKHARAIRDGGVPTPAADAIVDAIADATDSLVTEDFLRQELAIQTEQLEAKLDLSIERQRHENEQMRSELRHENEQMRQEMARQFEQMRQEMARQTERLEAKLDLSIERQRTEMANLRAEMWRAMYRLFGATVGATATIAGIAVALAKWVL